MKRVENKHFNWVVAQAQVQEDLTYLREDYGLDPEILAYAVDKNELAHLEYDKFDKELLLIYNALRDGQEMTYQTSPVSYFISGKDLVTIFGPGTDYLLTSFEDALAKRENLTLFEFVFTSLFLISRTYFPVLEGLNRERHDLNLRLRQSTSKEGLLELSDLETGLIYLVSASKQNASLLEQLQGQTFYKELSEGEQEQFEDAHIEARQLMEMTTLSSQITEQLEGTYNNILNNELNDTMKVLTKLSILLTIPSIITGFFGMNVTLPQVFTQDKNAWVWVIVLSVILWGVFGIFLGFYMKQWQFGFKKKK
ncbi:magnesium transporter CorA family protein [Streptococcus loxodontisalivarius]|uniref:Mg2+ and Co2+ transporter CorA n=1 Tax=Streptococcus loxodontisalivarius TaxID=1349415 RepID=A0ABS2PSQ3_9STRE|nr:magnesium transporter CorA family protein [Streptococcus loxodontisalivarius]MBM7643081.1 Mg2+ and Co2+ transporter CorA [Streptococcus loxodontisalivarius]